MTSISGVGGFRPPPPKPPSFETLDSDSNSSLSLDEFKAGAPPRSGASLAASQDYGYAAQPGAQDASSSSYSQAAQQRGLIDVGRQNATRRLIRVRCCGSRHRQCGFSRR